MAIYLASVHGEVHGMCQVIDIETVADALAAVHKIRRACNQRRREALDPVRAWTRDDARTQDHQFHVAGRTQLLQLPLGVRLAAREGMGHLGRSTGNLYAVSTAGSIAGTLVTSFWLIPVLSLEPLVVWTGIALLAVALLALSLKPEAVVDDEAPRATRLANKVVPATLALALLGTALGGYVLWRVAPVPTENEQGEAILFRADTQYHRITVTEGDGARHLRFDHSHQSAISIDDPYESRIRYPDYMHLAMALKPDAKRVLVLGLGGGAITKRFWRDYPGVSVDSVEIDPVVVDVARKYFWLPEEIAIRNNRYASYKEWGERKYLRLTPGDVIDYNFVFADMKELAERFRIECVVYDPWNAEHFTQQLFDELSIERIQFQQTVKTFNRPTQEYERRIINATLKHPNHPILNWQASHVMIRHDPNQNIRPVKRDRHDYRTIDGIVAGIMSLAKAMEEEPVGFCVSLS